MATNSFNRAKRVLTRSNLSVSSIPDDVLVQCALDVRRVLSLLAPAKAEFLSKQITHAALLDLSQSPYVKYTRLVFFKHCRKLLIKNTSSKDFALTLHKTLEKMFIPQKIEIEQLLLLVLKDGLNEPLDSLSAIFETSQGTIQTRLHKILQNNLSGEGHQKSSGSHSCYLYEGRIEFEFSYEKKITPTEIMGCALCIEKIEKIRNRRRLFSELLSSIDATLPQKDTESLFRTHRQIDFNWAHAPWYIRILIEGLLAGSIVIGVVLSIPKIQSAYETWVERRLEIYNVAESHLSPKSDLSNSEDKTQTGAAGASESTPENQEKLLAPPLRAETEFIGQDAVKPTSDRIYRVLVRTDTVDDSRSAVFKVLTEAQFAPNEGTPAVGAELPGGIMFDIFIPLEHYRRVVQAISKVGESKLIVTRSREAGIRGKAHMKIWIQRI